MSLILGLTGSIGMGKSTTADMFRKLGIVVFDSDACVHKLYANEAVPLIEEAFPGTALKGQVDRVKLSEYVVGNEKEMKRLEAIIHPLVHREEQEFRQRVEDQGLGIGVLDHPLLFEMGRDQTVDGIVVVTAPFEVQKKRVLARSNMSEEKFLAILARQTSDEEKRQKADFIIDTSLGMEAAYQAVEEIVEKISAGDWHRSP